MTLHAKTRLIKHCKLVKPGFKRVLKGFQNPQNRVSKGFRTRFSRVSNGFLKGFERVSKGFRTSFQRVSRGSRTGFQRVFKVFPKRFQCKQGFPKGFLKRFKSVSKVGKASKGVSKVSKALMKGFSNSVALYET